MTISPLSEMSFVSDAVSAKPGQMLQNVQKAQSDASDSNFQSLIDSVSRAQEAPVKVSDNKQMERIVQIEKPFHSLEVSSLSVILFQNNK